MSASIKKTVQFAVFIAGDNDRTATDLDAIKVERLLHLRIMAEVDPSALEDVLDFHLEQFVIGVDVAVHAEHTLVGFVHNVL